MEPFIIAALVIFAVWGIYLLPSVFGHRREAPLTSTQEFDKFTRKVADVQRHQYDAGSSNARDIVRKRRRRTLIVLGSLSLVTLVLAWRFQSLNWLLASLAVDAGIALYLAMLAQLRFQRAAKVSSRYFADHSLTPEEPQVRVVAKG